MCLCPSPLSYKDLDGEEQVIMIPCNQCYECLIQQQNSWKIRMIEEAKVWKYAYFFTLTYSEDKLPCNIVAEFPEGREVVGECRGSAASDLLLDSYEQVLSTACKKDVQDWLKRYRTSYLRRRAHSLGCYVRDITSDKELYDRCKARFSYFITAEYAPDGYYTDRHGMQRRSTMRPHYHGILFTSIPQAEIMRLFGDWRQRFGFFQMSRVRQRNNSANAASSCANYCAKYCCKGSFSSRLDDISAGVIEKPWRIMSKGIGSSYLNNASFHTARPYRMTFSDYVDRCLQNAFYFDGSFKYKLPRYYYERIFYTKTTQIRESYKGPEKGYKMALVSRYISKSALSVEMQVRLRNRPLIVYQQRFKDLRASRPDLSDDEIHTFLYDCERISLEGRRVAARDKLYTFYRDSDFNNPKLKAI